MSKIKQTSTDKVRGKLVKYKRGDCFVIDCGNSYYLGAFITEKFNKYYDFTLIEYYEKTKPNMSNFKEGKFFGTRFGSLEDIEYAVDKCMIECKYIDSYNQIEFLNNILLIDEIGRHSYHYENDIKDLLIHYQKEISIRIEKTKNAEKFPEIGFVSTHLIDMKHIIKSEKGFFKKLFSVKQ